VWLGGANFKRPVTLTARAPLAPLPPRAEPRVHADGSVDAPIARWSASVHDTDIAGPPLLTAPKPSDPPAPPRAVAPSRAGSPGGANLGRAAGLGERAHAAPPGGGAPSDLGGTPAFTARSEPRTGANTPPALAGDGLAALLAATRDSLIAFQQAQARTADVHAEFLRGQARANEAFGDLFRGHTSLLERAAGAPVGAIGGALSGIAGAYAPPTTAAPVAATHAALADAVLRPTGPDRATTLDFPRNDAPMIRGSDDLPPMLSAQSLASAIKAGQPIPEPSRGAPAPRVAPTNDVSTVLFATVADKTGYPADLLTPAMDLEADLGVDSIKRVEILAALQDALPEAPAIPEDEIGALRTLGDLIARLRGGGAAHAPAAPDVSAVLFATVADKTGYPADLLTAAMDLEADLGVDSIKRVEILSALQDALPDAPAIPEDEIGALRTLGDLIARLNAAPAGVVAARPLAPAALAPQLQRRRSRADVSRAVFDVVADKTGYPKDLLGIAMELEGDLGIDSIKRVEILSAIHEALPGAPELPEDELAALRTLGDIIEKLGGSLGPEPSPPGGGIAAPRVNAAPQEQSASPAPTPQARQAPRAAAPDVHAALFATVAERTGYPVDLLGPSMELEGDLGIDSIKRVEILSAIQEALPGLPDPPEDEIAAARTLGDLAAVIRANQRGAGPAAPAALPPAAPAAATLAGPVRREVLVVPAADGEGVTLPSPLAITRDRLGLADRLAAALRDLGAPSTIVDPDWSTVATVAEALPAGVRGVVHLAALGAVDGDLRARIRGAFLLAKAAPDATFFAAVSGLGGTFGHEGVVGEPLHGALAGLVKTLAQERPAVRALAIDVDPDRVDARTLAEELLTDRGAVEIGLADEIVTLDAAPVAIGDGPDAAPLDEGDLVVVSGGARGVTAAVVREVARRWRPSLLLLGRSPVAKDDPDWARAVADDALKPALIARLRAEQAPFDPRRVEREIAAVRTAREVRATLADLAELGCVARYVAVDVTDADAVRAAVVPAARALGPVRGIIHGAGVIADKLIVDKDPADFDRVWATKVDGLDALLKAVRTDELKVVAVFSSVAGRYGNRGQADYAMANEAITHVAHALRAAGVPHAKALHWGPWAGGMVTPTLAAAFTARGLDLVGLDQGAAAFCDELSRGGPAVEVVIGGPESPGALFGASGASTVSVTTSGEEPLVLHAGQTFLDDHRIDGKPVLPFVMALEFMAATARRLHPELRFVSVREVAVLKGVVLDAEGATLTLRWKPVAAEVPGGASIAFEIVGATNKAGLPTVHYRGTADLGPQAAGGARFGGSNGLGAAAYPFAVAEAYERFLFHGPGFQGIERVVGMSDHGIVGALASSRPKRLGVDAQRWTTDPVALDSALQLVGLWVREHQGASALPSYVGRYTQLAPFRGVVQAHIALSPGKAAQGRYDATFVDDAGRVVARIEGGQYTAMKGLNERYRAD
jgi:acyl carrier protein/NADP-dependent 3-hydroxy acid dehydrogenase YdfG